MTNEMGLKIDLCEGGAKTRENEGSPPIHGAAERPGKMRTDITALGK